MALFHPLLGILIAQPDIEQQRGQRIEIGLHISGVDIHTGAVGVERLHPVFNDQRSVLDILLIQISR